MRGEQTHEAVVSAPASLVWAAYRGVELGRLVSQLLPDVVEKVEVIEGDGGVGTIIKLIFPPGTPGGDMKEIFKVMDDEKRVKVTEVLEGGHKALGFDHFGVRVEIIEKDAETTIIRTATLYEYDHDSKPELAAFVSTKGLGTVAEVIGKYVVDKKSKA